MNEAMSPSAIQAIEQRMRWLETHTDRLVIDADVHLTDPGSLDTVRRQRFESELNYYHGRPISAEDAIREMDMAEVNMAVVWQNPMVTAHNYNDDPEHNTRVLTAANRYLWDSGLRFPDRFIPAGWVDPKACGLENTLAMVDLLVSEFGFLIIKMNPSKGKFPIDNPQVMAVVDRIVALGGIPAFHFGADSPNTPVEGIRCLAERHPDHPLIAVHMGGGGAGYDAAEQLYLDARRVGLNCPNIRFVLSTKRDVHIESDLITYQMAGGPFRHNLFCGSDAPFGRMTWNFGGFRAMFRSLLDGARHTDARVRANPGLFTPEAVRDYLGGNFARFAAEGYRRLLAAHVPLTPLAIS
jgi:predicted TIM-barrel fold metal-dependent hydrolase